MPLSPLPPLPGERGTSRSTNGEALGAPRPVSLRRCRSGLAGGAGLILSAAFGRRVTKASVATRKTKATALTFNPRPTMLKKFKKNDVAAPEAPGEMPGDAPGETATPAARPINPEVDARLNAYIENNQRDFAHYTKLVAEDPQRAVRTLLLKDMTKHEADMKLVFKQLPAAQEYFEKLAPEEQAKIKERLSKVNPFYHEKAFVGEMIRHKNAQSFAQNRREFLGVKAAPSGPSIAAG